ncbi:MAG TPA: sigma-70 family RNA polymerase sigma factor [Eubacteriaceae bacterium]|nr:sigma-70 family RNA polymerase sigma factor [Eubacteriaceae bacterium]
MEDIFLIKNAKSGDKDALVTLIMNKKNEYYGLALLYMKNQEDALDALEDMIVILYSKIHSLRKPEAFYSWSKKILVSCCLNKIKKDKRIVLIDEWDQEDKKNYFREKDQEIDLDKELEKLSFKHREAIKLRYYLDYDYETISKLTNTPIGTVKSRIFNGLKRLRENMGGEYR